MSVLNKISFYQNRRDAVPDQELAKELAITENQDGIREIAENLWNSNKNIQSDCIKVLYEIGYLKPELITEFADDFLKLLSSKNNRLVWGGMIAISTISQLIPSELFSHLNEIIDAVKKGSVITIDAGIKALANIASANEKFNQKIFPFLLNHLQTCRPKDVPAHAESISVAVSVNNQQKFKAVLLKRIKNLKPTQIKRIEKILKKL